jgi:hypothetical protein
MYSIDVATIKSEKVVCVLSNEDGSFTFLNTALDFGEAAYAIYSPKEELFDKACELPNWEEICGRVSFLTANEFSALLIEVAMEKAA